MKKFVLLFALLGVVSFTVNAQSCSKSKAACSKSKTACSKSKTAALSTSAVDAASADINIQKRVCQKSGTVSYVRKDVCSQSGKVSYANVEFCTKSGKFVNVSPSEGAGETMTAKTVAGSAGTSAKKACCASKASCSKGGAAKSAAMTTTGAGATAAKKSCCAGKKSCSKSAKASASNAAAPAKLVKAEEATQK